jgi:HemY protein
MKILRIAIFLVITAAIVAAEIWLANSPGSVTVHWRDYRIDTSFAVILHVVLFVTVVVAVLYRLWGGIKRAPEQLRMWGQLRRQRRGYDALSQGLIAAAAGDAPGALRHAKKASALLDSPPIAKVLTAQAAELSGDTESARGTYQELADDPQTALLGLRGLLAQARARGNLREALRLADEAYRLRPDAEGLLTQRLELQIAAASWGDAEATVREAVKRKEISAEEGNRQRAAMLFAEAQFADQAGDKERAQKQAEAAVKLNPNFVAAVAKTAELLDAAGRKRRATRLLEQSWALGPHPTLAAAYRALEPEIDAIAQLKRIARLVENAPEDWQSHIALAEAALAAKLWGEARAHLGKAEAIALTPKLCRLMADLESGEYNEQEKAGAWLARTAEAMPDDAWLCGECGAEAEIWTVCCAHCGGFNTLKWGPPPRVARLPAPKGDASAPDDSARGQNLLTADKA